MMWSRHFLEAKAGAEAGNETRRDRGQGKVDGD